MTMHYPKRMHPHFQQKILIFRQLGQFRNNMRSKYNLCKILDSANFKTEFMLNLIRKFINDLSIFKKSSYHGR